MKRFIEVLEHIQNVNIKSLTVDILADNFNNFWLIDAYECLKFPKPDKLAMTTKTKKKLTQRANHCSCGVYCDIEYDIAKLFEDDDDFNPNMPI